MVFDEDGCACGGAGCPACSGGGDEAPAPEAAPEGGDDLGGGEGEPAGESDMGL